MAVRKIKLGRKAKLYVGGTLVKNVKNVTPAMDKELFDATTKDSDGWKNEIGVTKELSLEFDLLLDDTETMYRTLVDAWIADTALTIKWLDAPPEDGGEGVEAEYIIANISPPHTLGEGIVVKVTAKPTISDTPPRWVTGS